MARSSKRFARPLSLPSATVTRSLPRSTGRTGHPRRGQSAPTKALKEAYKQVEDQEDEHLYHTTGWGRELWIEALGTRAVLPPPEQKDVKTAIGAARAKNVCTDMT